MHLNPRKETATMRIPISVVTVQVLAVLVIIGILVIV
jgi:hypothetical protein